MLDSRFCGNDTHSVHSPSFRPSAARAGIQALCQRRAGPPSKTVLDPRTPLSRWVQRKYSRLSDPILKLDCPL